MVNKGARQVALEVLHRVEIQEAYANLALVQIADKEHLQGPERRLATELVYGTLKNRGLLDWVLAQYLRTGIDKLTPWIRDILRLGAYQLLFLDRIPISAACNESVELAKRYGHLGTARLVNAVLRNLARRTGEIEYPDPVTDPVLHLSVRYSHPQWLVERWLDLFGYSETEALCTSDNATPPLVVRVNTLHIERSTLQEALIEAGLRVQSSDVVPEGLRVEGYDRIEEMPGFREGHFMVQDETSILIGHLVSPQPGQQVLDACAAPGGKSTHLAQLMHNNGRILAGDVHQSRLKLIRENCLRLGTTIVEPVCMDAREIPPDLIQALDVVLVDAPCSGTGVLRRKPDARWRKRSEDWADLVPLQKQILHSAAQCVRPGGVLVYSTCSVDPTENGAVVETFLEQHSDYTLESLNPYLPAGAERWQDVRETAGLGWVQLYPHRHGTDGFYGARMRRRPQ